MAKYNSMKDFENEVKSNGASPAIQNALIKACKFYRGYIIKKVKSGFIISNSVFNDSACVASNISIAKKWVDCEINELSN